MLGIVIVIAFGVMLLLHGIVCLLWIKFDSDFFSKSMANMSIVITAPMLRYMPKFSSVHANLITKFVVFVVFAIIGHFTSVYVVSIIICVLSTAEILKWWERRKQYKFEQRTNIRKSLSPIFYSFSTLLIYQIFLNVLIHFVK